jgi:hypothetical protein
MSASYWRDRSAPIIAAVLAEHKDSDDKTRRAALRAAYPFGPRLHHPYKIWCDEICKQLGRPASIEQKELGGMFGLTL